MSGEARLLRMLEPTVRPMGSPSPGIQPRGAVEGLSFDEVLRQTESAQPLRITPAAQESLDEMGIEIDEDRLAALGRATTHAGDAGARRALVLSDGLAAVVDVDDRIMTEAMSEEQMREQVVTNIDAAIWAEASAPAPASSRLRL